MVHEFMRDMDDCLLRCFSAIFPTLTSDEIRAANIQQLVDTDSLAGVTLLAMIDQEFGVDLSMANLLTLQTFQAVQRHLQEQQRAQEIH